MSRSVAQDYARYRQPMHISELLAETFKLTQQPDDLTAWVDSQPMPGQGVLFCDEVNSEFRVEYTGNLRVEHPVK